MKIGFKGRKSMLDFILANYMIFVVIAIILLLGLFGYIMDKKKYIQYRQEILNEGKVSESLENVAEISNVAPAVKVNEVEASAVEDNSAQTIDPLSGNVNN